MAPKSVSYTHLDVYKRQAMSQMRGDFSRRLESLRERLLELASLLELELDFSEEDVEFASREKLRELADEIHGVVTRLASSFATGAALKEGVPVAIVGATNAGKSTLLNRLLGDDRAIVSDIHGTTRDIIEDRIEIGGVLFRLIDTAGLRDTTDAVSYTHLDVYKRQVLLRKHSNQANRMSLNELRLLQNLCSYKTGYFDTHLIGHQWAGIL